MTRPLSHPAARLLDEAGPTVSLAEAAKVLGISVNTAYAAVKRGELGVRTLRYGRRWRIPTADLRRVVGLADISGGVL
jgi:excisionase family DNA binding protein